MFNKEAI